MERRPTSNATAAAQVGPRSLLTSRAVALGVLLLMIVGSSAIPVKQLLEQRDRIAQLQSELAANKATVARLTSEVERWNDPAYVKAQVRTHLHWVMPGEIGFFITSSEDIPAVEQFAVTTSTKSEVWYSVLWKSVKKAAVPAAPAS
jgi:cell division protein FtsB